MAFKGFQRPSTAIPESRRPPGSINAALHELPVRHKTGFAAFNRVIYLPRTGLIVFAAHLRDTGIGCIVLVGNETYPHGGHDIWVTDWELVRAVILDDGHLEDAAYESARRPFEPIMDEPDEVTQNEVPPERS